MNPISLLFRFLPMVFGNTVALYIATQNIPGFVVEQSLQTLIIAGGILTFINMFIKPVIRFFFTPFIFLTLGLGLIVVNAITLVILDYLTPTVTITGLLPLFEAAILISVVNMVIGLLGDII